MTSAPDARRLAHSHVVCDRLAREQAANFYHGFRLLPREQRRAMSALYAFARIADDLADGPENIEVKRRQLADWRRQLHAALEDEAEHAVLPALVDAVRRFSIPVEHLDAILDGVVMDLDISRYATFAELTIYCHRVASAVGLCCIHIWGFRDPKMALAQATAAGVAFQLTNILRDVAEDIARDRVYLPQEDLAACGYDEARLRQGVCDDAFRTLMRFEARRALELYDVSLPLAELLPPPGRAVFLTLWRTYRSLLDAIERRDYDVFRGRVRLSRGYKLWLAARAIPIRLGWF
jgi:phytoene synthase